MQVKRTDTMQNPITAAEVKLEVYEGELVISHEKECWFFSLDNFMELVETYLGDTS